MRHTKAKWFIYTLLVGLLPFISRFLIFILTEEKSLSFLFEPIDFVTLGLVLNITNINQLVDMKDVEEVWKITRVGVSILNIVIISVCYAICAMAQLTKEKFVMFDNTAILIVSIILAIVSVIFSYSIFDGMKVIKEMKGVVIDG